MPELAEEAMRVAARGAWTRAAIELIERLQQTQGNAIAEAARISAETIAAGGLVHMFGTGHSRMAVEEMFPRYGSFPGFHPLVELSTTFHTQVVGTNGQRQAMFNERIEGLAKVILSNVSVGASDSMIVCSTGGTTANPIEMAMEGRRRGLPVVAITAVDHSKASSSQHSSGTRLLDHADVVIDLGTPIGDALVYLPGLDVPVGPGSSAAYVAVINEIKVQTAEILLERGAMPPVLTSGTVTDPQDSAARFDAAYREHARRLARVLSGNERDTGPQ
jgi:uncharacterized phosphosugar-binding protein